MIRSTQPADTPILVELARKVGVFKPAELVALREVLDDYFASQRALGHHAVTLEIEQRVAGFAYYAPAAMTDRTWFVYWIAVEKGTQSRGLGGALLKHLETEIKLAQGRLILIETSGLAHYEPARGFYRKHGYEQASVLADFYADGDDLVVFRKRLAPA
jgi:ribosomal protein S18 acetylase RimI-like enzyme